MSDHYTYRITWSEEDQEFVATCAEFPSLSHLAETRAEAIEGIVKLVQDVVEDMRASGTPVPTPISERSFSGKFSARVTPEVHRRLALEAAEWKVSMSRLVTYKLTQPTPALHVQVQPVKRREKQVA